MSNDGPARRSEREEERASLPPQHESDRWVRESAKAPPVQRPAKVRAPSDWQVAAEAIKELRERVGEKRAERLARYMRDAGRAYLTERWTDARKALRPLLAEAGDAPAVQELDGMVAYRMGRWAAALEQLTAAHRATGSYELYPAMADAHRALGRPEAVAELWEELRQASPAPDVVAEGRIVMAASLADQGRIPDAVALLRKMPRPRRDPQLHHLRTWYSLGDLYDRSGDPGRARAMFERVAAVDPEVADVVHRLALLD